jgi:hypothetical protein
MEIKSLPPQVGGCFLPMMWMQSKRFAFGPPKKGIQTEISIAPVAGENFLFISPNRSTLNYHKSNNQPNTEGVASHWPAPACGP